MIPRRSRRLVTLGLHFNNHRLKHNVEVEIIIEEQIKLILVTEKAPENAFEKASVDFEELHLNSIQLLSIYVILSRTRWEREPKTNIRQ